MTPNIKRHRREPLPYADSTALVLGGTSGIGLTTAQRLLRLGVTRLAIVGRDPDRTAAAAALLAKMWPQMSINPVRADASTAKGAEAAVEATLERFGAVDIAISSTVPSNVTPELLFRTDPEDIIRTLTSLAAPPIHLTRAVLPAMRTRNSGSIVLIASDAAKVATPGESVIGGAMAAIVMFARAAALECKRDGIRVNVVTPSIVEETPTGQRMLDDGFSAKIFRSAVRLADLGVPSAEDVSRLVCHLAGPDSARVTGQVVSINGGISTA